MATFNKFNSFTEKVAEKSMNLGSDTLKVMLTNTAPVAGDSLYSGISGTEVANGNGYTTAGTAATISSSAQSSGVYKLVLADVVFTASGAVGPFRYAVLYDSTSGDLIGWWDYASSISLANGESFTVDFDPTTGVLTIT